ncbi:MAG: response regulator [Myxococcota bacterium]
MIEPHTERDASPARPPAIREIPPIRVLVVEDDVEMRRLLTVTLERDGYDVVDVGSTREAKLEMLIAEHAGHDWVPRLIVTDRRMPDGDGLDLVAELRAHWWWMPVVVVTSFADGDVVRRATALGCCRVLAKPVELEVVRRAVRDAVAR